MKSYPIIMNESSSIEGIIKQWQWQQYKKGIYSGDKLTPEKFDAIAMDADTYIGCKTETRRLSGLDEINKNPDALKFWSMTTDGYALFFPSWFEGRQGEEPGNGMPIKIKCHYGVPGDEMYVKESWRWEDGYLGSGWYMHKGEHSSGDPNLIWNRPWTMPREATRIILVNEGVTIERLQNITEEGAYREGVISNNEKFGLMSASVVNKAKWEFMQLWNEIPEIIHWNLNPWVWVIKFSVKEVIE